MPAPAPQLRNHPFLAGMSEAHLARISGCCVADVRTFPAGATIFHQGEAADACYLLEAGDVALQVFRPAGGPHTLQTLHGGDVLGWSWLFAPYRWSFDASAVTPVRAIALDAVRLREAKAGDCEFGYELMRRFAQVVVDRLQATRLQLLDVYASRG